MRPVLFDSSIYITALRTGSDAALSLRRLSDTSPVWVSAVVLEELYAGTNSRDFQAIRRLEHDFERTRRILVPNLTDWVQAGRYESGLDPLTPVGGPTSEVVGPGAGPSPSRLVTAANLTLNQGQSGAISLSLAAQGNENALAFSLAFDPPSSISRAQPL